MIFSSEMKKDCYLFDLNGGVLQFTSFSNIPWEQFENHIFIIKNMDNCHLEAREKGQESRHAKSKLSPANCTINTNQEMKVTESLSREASKQKPCYLI